MITLVVLLVSVAGTAYGLGASGATVRRQADRLSPPPRAGPGRHRRFGRRSDPGPWATHDPARRGGQRDTGVLEPWQFRICHGHTRSRPVQRPANPRRIDGRGAIHRAVRWLVHFIGRSGTAVSDGRQSAGLSGLRPVGDTDSRSCRERDRSMPTAIGSGRRRIALNTKLEPIAIC